MRSNGISPIARSHTASRGRHRERDQFIFAPLRPIRRGDGVFWRRSASAKGTAGGLATLRRSVACIVMRIECGHHNLLCNCLRYDRQGRRRYGGCDAGGGRVPRPLAGSSETPNSVSGLDSFMHHLPTPTSNAAGMHNLAALVGDHRSHLTNAPHFIARNLISSMHFSGLILTSNAPSPDASLGSHSHMPPIETSALAILGSIIKSSAMTKYVFFITIAPSRGHGNLHGHVAIAMTDIITFATAGRITTKRPELKFTISISSLLDSIATRMHAAIAKAATFIDTACPPFSRATRDSLLPPPVPAAGIVDNNLASGIVPMTSHADRWPAHPFITTVLLPRLLAAPYSGERLLSSGRGLSPAALCQPIRSAPCEGAAPHAEHYGNVSLSVSNAVSLVNHAPHQQTFLYTFAM